MWRKTNSSSLSFFQLLHIPDYINLGHTLMLLLFWVWYYITGDWFLMFWDCCPVKQNHTQEQKPQLHYYKKLKTHVGNFNRLHSVVLWHSNISTCEEKYGKVHTCTGTEAHTGCAAHRGSRGIALLFLDHGTRRGWEVSVMPRPLFTPRKDPVPIVKEAGWAPALVWTGAENLAPTGIRFLDRPAHSQSLYRLHYLAHISTCTAVKHNKLLLNSSVIATCFLVLETIIMQQTT